MHFVFRDPVVRFAFELPVADRWFQGDRFAVKDQRPLRGTDWGDDLLTAPAAAPVASSSKFYRDVDFSLLQFFR
jgi:hypothetical protein